MHAHGYLRQRRGKRKRGVHSVATRHHPLLPPPAATHPLPDTACSCKAACCSDAHLQTRRHEAVPLVTGQLPLPSGWKRKKRFTVSGKSSRPTVSIPSTEHIVIMSIGTYRYECFVHNLRPKATLCRGTMQGRMTAASGTRPTRRGMQDGGGVNTNAPPHEKKKDHRQQSESSDDDSTSATAGRSMRMLKSSKQNHAVCRAGSSKRIRATPGQGFVPNTCVWPPVMWGPESQDTPPVADADTPP